MAIKTFLSMPKHKDIQVLWKLGSYRSQNAELLEVANSILQDFIASGRVRIVEWLAVDPVVLLSTGNIACSVHHGGASTWFEALRYGVPQILLPAWFDCYDDAKRTEYFGFGIWGNKSSAPEVNSAELVAAMNAIFEDSKYRSKALDIAARIGTVEGRTIAADHILKAAALECSTWGRMPSEAPEVEHIRNKNGKTLTCLKPGKPSTSSLYYAFQAACMITHITFHLWSIPLCLFLLTAPVNFIIAGVLYRLLFRQPLSVGTATFHVLGMLWALYVAYFIFQILDSSAGEENATPLRYRLLQKTPIWKAYCKARATYFPITLWISCPLPPTRSYIIGYHPHGTCAIGLAVLDHDKLLPGTKLYFMVHAIAFRIPVMTDIAQMLGAKSISAAGVRAQLTTGGHDGKGAGNLVAISVGGGKEARVARPHSMDVVVRCRRGFVKQAIEAGAYIVPMISFGENELMDLVDDDAGFIAGVIKKVFTILYKTKNQEDVKLYQGIGGMPFLAPYRKPISFVLGRPISVVKQAKPSEDYVTEIQERYAHDLEQLWDDWRDTFGIDPSVEFRIVE